MFGEFSQKEVAELFSVEVEHLEVGREGDREGREGGGKDEREGEVKW